MPSLFFSPGLYVEIEFSPLLVNALVEVPYRETERFQIKLH